MKRFEDEERLIAKVRSSETYLIKTKPEEILKKAQGSFTPTRKERKRRDPFLIPALSLGGACLVAASLVCAFLFPWGPSSPSPLYADANSTLIQELVSFSSFCSSQGNDLAKGPLFKRKNAASDAERSAFEKTAGAFEEYFPFFSSCFHYSPSSLRVLNSVRAEGGSIPLDEYPYQTDGYYEGELLFSFYYGDLSGLSKEDGFSFEAMFSSSSGIYRTSVEKSVERDGDESEEEITVSFVNVDDPGDVFQIGQEKESEGKEKEHAYSLKRFPSSSRKEPSLCLSFELEEEEDDRETSFSIETEAEEYSFEDILFHQAVYSFSAEAKIGGQEYEFEGMSLSLEEQGHRYRWGDEKIFFAE